MIRLILYNYSFSILTREDVIFDSQFGCFASQSHAAMNFVLIDGKKSLHCFLVILSFSCVSITSSLVSYLLEIEALWLFVAFVDLEWNFISLSL